MQDTPRPTDAPPRPSKRRTPVLTLSAAAALIALAAIGFVLFRAGPPAPAREAAPTLPEPVRPSDPKASLRRELRLDWTTPASWAALPAPGFGQLARYRLTDGAEPTPQTAEVDVTWNFPGASPAVAALLDTWTALPRAQDGSAVPLTVERFNVGYLEVTFVHAAAAQIAGTVGQPLDNEGAHTFIAATVRRGPAGDIHLRCIGPSALLQPRLEEFRAMLRSITIAPPGAADFSN